MKRIKYLLYSVLLLLIVLPPIKVSADIGPKPSVIIEFEGLEGEVYYATLLSEKTSTGPWSLGDDYYDYMGDESVFEKFCDYEDNDGFSFLSFMENCSEDHTLDWTYYPPGTFKVLVYLPEYDVFLTDGHIYEKYAFDSYFTVTVSNMDIQESIELTTKKSYDYSIEIISLLARVAATVIIEFLIAWLFRYRDKKALKLIVWINIVTQVILNILLNVINYRSGHYAFVFHYIWMEVVILMMEAAVYKRKLEPEKHPGRYAVVANIVSFIIGMWLAKTIPGIF